MEKNRFKQLLESPMGYVKPLVMEQPINTLTSGGTTDDKGKLIQVMMDKLESMKNDQRFTADDVCEVLINNCNHFKNKVDIFAK